MKLSSLYVLCALAMLIAPSALAADDLGAPTLSPADAGPFVQVAGGSGHVCALRADGGLTCWAPREMGGQCYATTPPGPYSQVAAGLGYACGLKTDGTVTCWGIAAYEGDVPVCFQWNTADPATRQEAWLDTSVRYASIVAGSDTLCGLSTGGHLVCSGYLRLAATSLHGIREAAAGGYHACVVDGTGRVRCLGPYVANLQADGTSIAGVLAPPSEHLSGLAMGSLISCGIKQDRGLLCWGHGLETGKLDPTPGLGVFNSLACMQDSKPADCSEPVFPDEDRLPPEPEEDPYMVYSNHPVVDYLFTSELEAGLLGMTAYPQSGAFKQVVVGSFRGCGLKTDGTIDCWGLSYTSSVSETVLQDPKAPKPVTQLTLWGDAGLCALLEGGRVGCWEVAPGFFKAAPPPPVK